MTARAGRAQAQAASPRAARQPPPLALPAEREAAVRVDAYALPAVRVLRSRRTLGPRLAWLAELHRAAERDADRLVTVPLAPEPDLSRVEIAALGDRVAMLARIDAFYRTARSRTRARIADGGGGLFAEAARLRATLLRGFDLLFRNDPAGRARVRDIRKGTGAEDLLQDVADVLALCDAHREALARLTKGEALAAQRLAQMQPELESYYAALELPSKKVKSLRDRVYTLALETAARIRSAARYEFADEPARRRAYRPFRAAGAHAAEGTPRAGRAAARK